MKSPTSSEAGFTVSENMKRYQAILLARLIQLAFTAGF